MKNAPRLGITALLAFAVSHVGSAGCVPTTSGPADRSLVLEARLASLKESPNAATTLTRARLLRACGRQRDALREVEAASDAARERLDWNALGALSDEAGDTLLEMADPQKALDVFGKHLRAALSTDDRVGRAKSLVDTAVALSRMGVVLRADEALGEARLLAEQALEEDPRTLEHIGITLDRLGQSEIAKRNFELAERIHASRGDATGRARAAAFAAAIASRSGTNAAAFEHAKAVAKESLDPEPNARLCAFEAEAALRDGDAVHAENRANEAARLADARGLADVGKRARLTRARAASTLGHVEVAIACAEQAAAMVEAERQNLTGAQARQEAGFEAFQIYRLLFSLQTQLPEDQRVSACFRTSELARARNQLDAVARSRLGSRASVGTSPEALALASNAKDADGRVRELTADLVRHRGDPTLAERHRNALWALEDANDAIEEASPWLARIALPEPPTLDEVRRTMLDPGSVLISYFVTRDLVTAIAIDDREAHLEVLATTPEALGVLVRGFRSAIASPGDEATARAKGAAMYGALIAPLERFVGQKRKLFILPHGPLASVPFEAFLDTSGHYLVESRDITYGLSATLGVELANARENPRVLRGFVGMGDPVYDWASFRAARAEGQPAESRGLTLWSGAASIGGAQSSPSGPALERLPGTGAELRAIAKHFGKDAKLYLRDQATEENVKAGVLGKSRIVHIASHGLLEPHFQALALSFDPSSKEDGLLMHQEIAALTLDADLVVLSACKTGNTYQRDGDSVAGLALALRAAGALRVVLSLWSVDDDATAKLMSDFYAPLVNHGTSYATSLASAKRSLIASGRSHPYFWSPFVLLGH